MCCDLLRLIAVCEGAVSFLLHTFFLHTNSQLTDKAAVCEKRLLASGDPPRNAGQEETKLDKNRGERWFGQARIYRMSPRRCLGKLGREKAIRR